MHALTTVSRDPIIISEAPRLDGKQRERNQHRPHTHDATRRGCVTAVTFLGLFWKQKRDFVPAAVLENRKENINRGKL